MTKSKLRNEISSSQIAALVNLYSKALVEALRAPGNPRDELNRFGSLLETVSQELESSMGDQRIYQDCWLRLNREVYLLDLTGWDLLEPSSWVPTRRG